MTLLKGAEALICRPGPPHRELCCFLGARVKDVRNKVPSMFWPSDYRLLLFQVGSDDTGRISLRTVKKDFRALGRQVRGLEAQAVFSSVLPAIGNNEELNMMGQLNKTWLQAWCALQGLGFVTSARFARSQACRQLIGAASPTGGVL